MLVLPLLLFRAATACAHLCTRLAHPRTLALSLSLTHPRTFSQSLAHARSLTLTLTHTCTLALSWALTHPRTLALAAAVALAHAAGTLAAAALATTLLRHCDTAAQRSHQNRDHQNLLVHIHPFLEINKTRPKV